MNINVIASGSSVGNAAIITYGKNSLLLDAGVHIEKIFNALDYDLTCLDAVLISHEHGDHSRSVKDLLKYPVDVYMSEGTAKALNINSRRIKILINKELCRIKDWFILPLKMIHDANFPLGFLIQIGKEKLLYAIDTAYIPYKNITGLTYIMVECNYSVDIVRKKVKDGELPQVMKNRLFASHMSLETYIKFLLANDLSKVKEIWLMHLSDRHSDRDAFKEEIQKLTGRLVRY